MPIFHPQFDGLSCCIWILIMSVTNILYHYNKNLNVSIFVDARCDGYPRMNFWTRILCLRCTAIKFRKHVVAKVADSSNFNTTYFKESISSWLISLFLNCLWLVIYDNYYTIFIFILLIVRINGTCLLRKCI